MHVCDILSPQNAFGGNKTVSMYGNLQKEVAVWFHFQARLKKCQYATPAHTGHFQHWSWDPRSRARPRPGPRQWSSRLRPRPRQQPSIQWKHCLEMNNVLRLPSLIFTIVICRDVTVNKTETETSFLAPDERFFMSGQQARFKVVA